MEEGGPSQEEVEDSQGFESYLLLSHHTPSPIDTHPAQAHNACEVGRRAVKVAGAGGLVELTLSQYARRAGISVYTARRRIKRGDLPYRRERGKYVVILPDEGVVEAGQAEMSRKPADRIRLRDEAADLAAEVARLRTELSDARELISELRRERDLLEQQLEARTRTEAEPVRELEAERLDQQ